MCRLRDSWHALRGYAALQDSRASAWAPSGSSATAEVGAAAPIVGRRARDAVRNDPYAARIVDLWTGSAVGAASPPALAGQGACLTRRNGRLRSPRRRPAVRA